MRYCQVFIILLSLHFFKVQSQTSEKLPFKGQINHTTIQIKCIKDRPDGKRVQSKGTGFFMQFIIDSLSIPCLVTNKHVVENSISGELKFTAATIDGNPDYQSTFNVNIKGFQDSFMFHPDKNVDLCLLPLGLIEKQINEHAEGKIPFIVFYGEDMIPPDSVWNSFTPLETVFMIGYPKGIIDYFNNTPVCRVGSTGTSPKLDYQGREEFLLDIVAMPGSSGSPIVLRKDGSLFNETTLFLVQMQ